MQASAATTSTAVVVATERIHKETCSTSSSSTRCRNFRTDRIQQLSATTMAPKYNPSQCSLKSPALLKNKNQLDATYYFIVLLIGSTCFGHYYAHHQELATIMLITHWSFRSWFAVCWRLGVVRLEQCPGCSPDTTPVWSSCWSSPIYDRFAQPAQWSLPPTTTRILLVPVQSVVRTAGYERRSPLIKAAWT